MGHVTALVDINKRCRRTGEKFPTHLWGRQEAFPCHAPRWPPRQLAPGQRLTGRLRSALSDWDHLALSAMMICRPDLWLSPAHARHHCFLSFEIPFCLCSAEASGTCEDSLAEHACVHKAVNFTSMRQTSWHDADWFFTHEDFLQPGATHGTFNS